MRPAVADDWLWCGYPHHFIGGVDCLFSLATWVGGGRWLVSTVGDYRPQGGDQKAIGIDGEMFETMVFATDPSVRDDGEPAVISWSDDVCCRRYRTVCDAVEGHMALCREFEARRG
jgi:hypothetical protein